MADDHKTKETIAQCLTRTIFQSYFSFKEYKPCICIAAYFSINFVLAVFHPEHCLRRQHRRFNPRIIAPDLKRDTLSDDDETSRNLFSLFCSITGLYPKKQWEELRLKYFAWKNVRLNYVNYLRNSSKYILTQSKYAIKIVLNILAAWQ